MNKELMTEQQLREQIVTMARSMFERGYATGGAGNLSLKLPNGHFLATPTGSSFGRLIAEELSVVDIDGNHISGEKPSKEVAFHLAIYRNNSKCNAIVHLHSTYLTALSCLEGLDRENAIKAFTPYFVMRIGELPVIPYLRPGDPQIAEELAQRASDYRAFLLANHGPVITGTDFEDAVDNAEELEETAKLAFILKDSNIRYLTDTEIQDLKGRGK
ncbi:TPA: aldolase [Vibrio alginolyticus]|uniref:3-oxo-tetronate 4-phosphate decarboxylase n=1 Tax=Vibrio alginolyticus TaxID=663 RepID=UPI001BD4CD65|nr:aldolase [Vibrio alginolyticus]EJV5950334.1 aldolase [Vibrio alginolyticus]ELB2852874.1 aldolase [Vibrio alginolyticus]MBS9863820.1 aldolase [Vibrio alginolyticus]MBS9886942.1 aldolase [Vibrio alginolyticus]MBS9904717.1 aldolase [Vibrio alginolyticus]